MNLRSWTFYKSGHYSESDNKIKASTLGSTARTPSFGNQVVEQLSEETLLESSEGLESARNRVASDSCVLIHKDHLRDKGGGEHHLVF